jgi:hypothetical protein
VGLNRYTIPATLRKYLVPYRHGISQAGRASPVIPSK